MHDLAPLSLTAPKQGIAPGGRDFQGAVAHLRLAATQGHVQSLFKLAHMTLHGMGA
jgi:TPR repeat protein